MQSPSPTWQSPQQPPSAAVVAGAAIMEKVLYEVKKTVVGQDALLERILVALLAQGHLLIEGVPGLAKRSPSIRLPKPSRAVFGAFSSPRTCSQPT